MIQNTSPAVHGGFINSGWEKTGVVFFKTYIHLCYIERGIATNKMFLFSFYILIGSCIGPLHDSRTMCMLTPTNQPTNSSPLPHDPSHLLFSYQLLSAYQLPTPPAYRLTLFSRLCLPASHLLMSLPTSSQPLLPTA